MILHFTRLVLRISVLAFVAAAAVMLFAFDGQRHAKPASADPAYGNIKFNPTSQVVLENHIISVPVIMNTCTDIAQNTKGTATSGATTTLTDTSKSWTVNQWVNFAVILTSGTGAPQQRKIISNTSNTLTVGFNWGSPLPGAGTKYEIVALSGAATGGTSTTLADTSKSWTTNQYVNADVTLISGTGSVQNRKVLSNTGNTLTVDQPWGNIQQFGTATDATSTTLVDSGSAWATNQFQNMQLELTGPGGSQIRTVASNTADTLTISSPWATLQGAASATGGTSTTLVDTTKNWSVNGFANKIVEFTGGPIAPLSRTIVSNTSNTLTIAGTWPVSDAGGANSGTATTLTDLTKNWVTNYAGYTVEITGGPGVGQSRVIASNTLTSLTVTSAWATIPTSSTSYQILRTPAATTTYVLRDGPAEGTGYQVRSVVSPVSGTGYQLLNLKCHAGGYGMTVNFNSAKFTVVSDNGFVSAVGTSTLSDSSKTWKVNQWVGTEVKIIGGAGFGQARTVVSNTATTLTLTTPWSTVPAPPAVNSGYQLGGITDGGFLATTGRSITCPTPGSYGTGTATISCVSFGSLPQGPTGSGNLVNLTLQAGSHQGGVLQNFSLTNAEVLQVDGTVSPVDVFAGSRRVILCPDSAPVNPGPDGLLNVGDQAVMSQAVYYHATLNPPSPFYSTRKDPNEDGFVNPGDQAILGSILGKRCVQP